VNEDPGVNQDEDLGEGPVLKKKVYWVPHTHWDREWYRSFQAFRARLVDSIDAVLDKLVAEPDFKFLLDGQTVVLEDFFEIRPERENEIRRAVAEGRLAIGPWYVQPDSLLPCGEAHIRNLLLGRAYSFAIGRVSKIAYTPDSFGHPAQFPQLFAGFGMRAFVYWRGNGNEIDQLPAEYCWQSPDGTGILACLMVKGYFSGALLPSDVDNAVKYLKITYDELAKRTEQDAVLIMNGVDHSPPDPQALEMARGLSKAHGLDVEIALLEDFVRQVKGELPVYQGSLIGGRLANLLPGVWSARMPLKLANRRAEITLVHVTEPLAVIARLQGLRDERASLLVGWRALLKNQAHDSIGGCSINRVHIQMQPRFFASQSLANETAMRVMERLAGQDQTRQTPVTKPFEVAIFNPSPYPRSGVVRMALDGGPAMQPSPDGLIYHPVLAANKPEGGYTADGHIVRFVPGDSDGRFFYQVHQHSVDLEIPVDDVPAFGYKRVVLQPADYADHTVDDGITIGNAYINLRLNASGGADVRLGEREFLGLFGVEDLLDRGDSYDADLLPDGDRCEFLRYKHTRRVHPNGTQVLAVERLYRTPRELTEERDKRGDEQTALRLYTDFILYPGSDELKVQVRLKNTAKDHRFRLLFPAGGSVTRYHYATTLDVASATVDKPDDSQWLHQAPDTFVHQGWISLNGLTVVAPGLPEAEVMADGTLAVTLVRSIGWLSRPDLTSRPGPAGPVIPVSDAQCLETIEAELTIFGGCDPIKAQQTEIPLAAVIAGDEPLLQADHSMFRLHSDSLLLSALKPVAHGEGFIVRFLNPGDEPASGEFVAGFGLARAERVSHDEERVIDVLSVSADNTLKLCLPPHRFQTYRLFAQAHN
jgi:mannosylglycerate hydrolase